VEGNLQGDLVIKPGGRSMTRAIIAA
jgi:hypothetical protein